MLSEHALSGLFLADHSGRWVHASARWCGMTGLEESAVLGEGWLVAVHADDVERVKKSWGEAVTEGRDFEKRFRPASGNGGEHWVEVSASRTGEGRTGQYVGCWTPVTARRDAEVRVKVYEAILSTSPDFAYIFGTDHRCIYANESLLKMWGLAWDETVGRSWLELGYEPWHAEMHDRELDTVIRTRHQWRSEVPFTGADGVTRMYDYIFMPVIGENGEVAAVAGITRDITTRKQAEDRMTFLSGLAGALAILTTEEEIMGTTVSLLGRHLKAHRCHFVECLKSEDRVKVGISWTNGAGRNLEGEYILSNYGGEEWWEQYAAGNLAIEDTRKDPLTSARRSSYEELEVISFAAQPYKRSGPVTAVLVVTQNVPRHWARHEIELVENVVSRVWPLVEQARAVESIRKSQQRMGLLAEAGRVILEADTPASMLGRMGETAAGYLQAEIFLILTASAEPGQYEVEYCSGLDAATVEEMGTIYLRPSTGRDAMAAGRREADERLAKADEEARRLLAGMGVRVYSSHPLLAGDELLGVMIFASRGRGTFTETEEEFMETLSHYVTGAYMRLRLVQSLKENDRRKDLFLATLAHELRNPLAPILTGLDIMKRSPGDGDVLARVTGIIERQTAQMVHLIDDLLDMSRVNTGKVVLKKSRAVLSEILNGAVEAANPLIAAKGHRLVLEAPPGIVTIEVDPARVAQVISNLLSNAAKYTPSGGVILLRAGVEGTALRITVSDNGQGIEAEDQQSIFDLFHQTSRGGDGLGIGLTLVRSLVELHGGTVAVRSDGHGLGSEFRVDLPACVLAEKTAVAGAGEADPAAKSSGKRILVVDDGRNAADVLALFFRMEGMEVAVAYDGKEGLEKARSFDPDLVIMDVGMPVMDGLEAARHMRADRLRARLVALSGWGREEDKGRATEAGFDDHIVKPACPADLRKMVEKWLG